MNELVPPRFLFRWSFVAKKQEKIPSRTGRLLDLGEEYRLPTLEGLDKRRDFASLKIAWNDRGLAISVNVSGRSRRPECVESELALSDGIRLWIDTRHTQTVHRATKFCHHFILLPAGGGPKRRDPIVRSMPVSRAREETALPDVGSVQTQSEVSSSGYWLDAWFPAEVFAGFDPATNGRIGFHYLVHDTDLGDQTLAVGGEFPYESDPSLWQTVELNDD
jgi:hypothetical protein